uniref:Protein kinase domain-containing protein n=1 Tax=Panagrolaimus sp. PS1159 TaxID=55785 RepID=A0AC35F1M3_9BILA
MKRPKPEVKGYEKIKSNSGKLQIGPEHYEDVRIEQLRLISELGFGACGNVSKRSLNNRILAVKEMRKTMDEDENKRIYMDLQVITCNDCPFIVQSYGYIITFDHVYICMETMTMCLEKLYKNHIKPQNMSIPEWMLGKITVPVMEALRYLKNEHEIIHRDVKPSNILININGNIKLCDFGISGKLIDSIAGTASLGCAAYLSPERFQPIEYDIRADIWSLGITLVELATLEYPYQFNNHFELMLAITSSPSPKLPDHFSSDFHDFVDSCLQKDVKLRPKYEILGKKNWYQMHKILDYDVEKWISSVLETEEDDD